MFKSNAALWAEYRDKSRIKLLCQQIAEEYSGPMRIMEVCGTHTMSIYHYGIRSLLPEGLQLISGPGCPVCVTDEKTVSAALALAKIPNIIFTTYGDMLRVPAGNTSLQRLRDEGADIRILLSPLDALELAEQHPERQIVFFAVGFETTAPLTAATLCRGKEKALQNFSVLCAHKTMPQALRSLLPGSAVDALLCPGHVAAVTGEAFFSFVPQDLKRSAAIAGFEPVDILEAVLAVVRMHAQGGAGLLNCYPRAVRPEGNPLAMKMMEQVFVPCDAVWRGLGEIADSGLAIGAAYREFDAAERFKAEIAAADCYRDNPACRCGFVLRGECTPEECPLFGKACTPDHPCGACMVSGEGACAAAYKYRRI